MYLSRRDLRLPLALCALALLWLAARGVVGLSPGFLFLLPALLLALPLLAGRYLGAERLSRVAGTQPPMRQRVAGGGPLRSRFRTILPRGGLLIGSSLAVRPPPAVPFAH